VDQRLKHLIEELVQAVNESLTVAPRINEVIEKIRDEGHEVLMIVEATICLKDQEGRSISDSEEVDLEISAEDRQFLKSLKISIDSEDNY